VNEVRVCKMAIGKLSWNIHIRLRFFLCDKIFASNGLGPRAISLLSVCVLVSRLDATGHS
jgi:hypothetical protein